MIWDTKKFKAEILALRLLKHSPPRLHLLRQQQIKQAVFADISGENLNYSAARYDHSARGLVWLGRVPNGTWRARLAKSVGVIGILAALATGTALASQSANPGDVLYTVKRATETVQLKLAGSEEAKASLQVKFAQKRILEARHIEGDENNNNSDNQTFGNASSSFGIGASAQTEPQSEENNPNNFSEAASSTRNRFNNINGQAPAASLTPAASGTGSGPETIRNKKNSESRLHAQARQDVENALNQLEQTQTKLENDGKAKAAESLGQNIQNLRQQALQQNLLEGSDGGEQDNNQLNPTSTPEGSSVDHNNTGSAATGSPGELPQQNGRSRRINSHTDNGQD